MNKERIYAGVLVLNALAFMFFAVKWLATPAAMAAPLGIQLTNADAITDAQAVYGGLELGLGVFLVICAIRPTLRVAGLLAATLTLLGLGLSRGGGILFAAEHVTGATWQLLTTDLVGGTLNAMALAFAARASARASAANPALRG